MIATMSTGDIANRIRAGCINGENIASATRLATSTGSHRQIRLWLRLSAPILEKSHPPAVAPRPIAKDRGNNQSVARIVPFTAQAHQKAASVTIAASSG